ncbi:uncharacterized protein [Linepithema humile]|uniref:uncharacterized protein n=1 Tax=Linepithema humile TaxID=83485 RepID=UPI00062352EC|nr:PREDICTED: uncharacterized protein LOC105678174 [Linepithema humile]XP_012232702.1 PREDICTED: uncharacterized protein LOC105678174 [Linepithema humile]XP_012232703.1 PREDICTED: uncharacterized protein LOC105678174 [Linepithema humile]
MKTFLELFLLSFTLQTFIVVGNAHPLTEYKEDFLKDNNEMKSLSITKNNTASSITPYICVYIPSDLDRCDFVGHHKSSENLWNLTHKLSEKKKCKLLKSNKKYLSHSTFVPEMKKVRTQKSIIIYEIQRCVPSRLPFNLPWCTDEEFSNKKSEIRKLYPFAIGFSKATHEFPKHDFSKRRNL